MNMLIMGGTSFVGKCFAIHAISKGYTVDIFTRGNNIVDYNGVNNHLIGDRKNLNDLKRLITKKYDYIVDFSAYFEEDMQLLCDVLDKSSIKRYVFCSTCSVYISPVAGKTLDENYPRGMDALFGGDYGFNKMKAEDYLMSTDIPYTIFRPVYIYGEYNYIFREAFLFDSIERGKITTIEDIYDAQFVYVMDLAKTFESCLDVDTSINQAYNLANPKSISWSELVATAIYATDKPAEVHVYSEEMIKESPTQVFPFVNAEMIFDISKLSRDGLYVPNTDLKDGLKNAYNWYKTVGSSVITRGKFDLI